MNLETFELKQLGVGSIFKLTLVLYAIFGLLAGGLFALLSAIGLMADPGPNDPPFTSVIFGVGAIVFFPIFYGVFGAISAALGAVIYNVVAGFAGGIKLKLHTGRASQDYQ